MSVGGRRLSKASLSEVVDPVHAGVVIVREVVRAGDGRRLTLSVSRHPHIFDARETRSASETLERSEAETEAFLARLSEEFRVFELGDREPPYPFLHPTLYSFKFEDEGGAAHGFTYRVEARAHHDAAYRRLVEAFEQFFKSRLIEDFFARDHAREKGREDEPTPPPAPWWKFW